MSDLFPASEGPEDRTAGADVVVCYRHPGRETRLYCTECERPICADCSIDAAVGQRCPACAQPEGRHRTVTARQAFGGTRSRLTTAVLTVTVLVSLPFLFRSELGVELADRLAQINVRVADGELWRLVTAALLHANLTHILFNMWALWIFGPQLEQRYGMASFGALYLASAAAGGAAFFVLQEGGAAVGASGAIFGLFGAWFQIGYRSRHNPAGRYLFNQLLFLVAINAALPLFVAGIAWQAHAGGFVAGFAIAWLWHNRASRSSHPERTRVAYALAFLVAAVVIVLLF